MKFRFFLFYFLLAFVGCSSSNDDIEKPDGNKNEEGNVTVTGDKVTINPLAYDQAFRNPMMGWRDVFSVGLDPIPAKYPLPFGSIYKEYIPWDRIENVKTDGVQMGRHRKKEHQSYPACIYSLDGHTDCQ